MIYIQVYWYSQFRDDFLEIGTPAQPLFYHQRVTFSITKKNWEDEFPILRCWRHNDIIHVWHLAEKGVASVSVLQYKKIKMIPWRYWNHFMNDLICYCIITYTTNFITCLNHITAYYFIIFFHLFKLFHPMLYIVHCGFIITFLQRFWIVYHIFNIWYYTQNHCIISLWYFFTYLNYFII